MRFPAPPARDAVKGCAGRIGASIDNHLDAAAWHREDRRSVSFHGT